MKQTVVDSVVLLRNSGEDDFESRPLRFLL